MERPKRKCRRLQGFDYGSPNYYFVTICTAGRKKLFGMPDSPTVYGVIAKNQILALESHFSALRVDCFTVMPDHIHLILAIGCGDDAERASPFPTLPVVVGSLKSGITREIHRKDPTCKVWQTSYYDRVVRETEYLLIRRYIEENSLKAEFLNETH